LGYTVEKREGTRRMWQNVGVIENTEMEVTHLIEGNQYAFRVAAENKVGVSDPTELTDQITAKSQYSKHPFHTHTHTHTHTYIYIYIYIYI